MPGVPPQVIQWVQRTYPQPRVDQEWLNDCYNWVTEEYHFDPTTQMDQIIRNVEVQLLESDLRDSMVPDTGLPQVSAEVKETIIRGPVLVQVLSIMDIGQSAFSLMNVRQARLERADMAGLARAEDDEDEGPVSSYPRSMLRFELTDGSVALPAVEHRRLPELKLGESKLGLKMILKNVPVRRGIAFLEPKCVVIKGHHVADLDAFQDRNFARALRERLRLPHDPALDEPDPQPEPEPLPQALAAAAAPPRPRTPEQRMNPNGVRSPSVRSPLQELAEPPTPPAAGLPAADHDDDAGQPRRRKLPARMNRTPSPEPPARRVAPLPPPDTRSRYFANTGPGAANPSAALAQERLLSPTGRPPIFVPDSDEEEEAAQMDWEITGEPRRQRASEPVIGNRNGRANGTGNENGSSSDFDMGDEDYFNDQAVLELADRVEREELALRSQTQSQGAALSLASSATAVQQQTGQSESTIVASASTGRTAVASSATLPGSSLGSRAGSEPGSSTARASYSVGARAQSSRPAVQRSAEEAADIITIEDSDVDDKENVPVLTRRVRRRVRRPPPSQNPEDIIELSD